METQEIKEIIIQKQQKYNDLVDFMKKASIITAITTAIAGVMAFIGISNIDNPNEILQFISESLAAFGFLISPFSLVVFMKVFNDRYKLNIKKETIDELLESIEKEEKEKTL